MLNHLEPFWLPVIERLPFSALLYFSPGATKLKLLYCKAPQNSLIIITMQSQPHTIVQRHVFFLMISDQKRIISLFT